MSQLVLTETSLIAKPTQIDFPAANQNIVDNIETILDHFNIDYQVLHNRVTFPCPVHGSSRAASANIFTDGRVASGNWRCWSSNCEQEIGYGAINLVKFLLEQRQGKMSYGAVIEFLEGITGAKFEPITIETADRRKFSRFVGKEPEKSERKLLISRERVRESLQIPAEYYLKRGFSREVLDKYDVGTCYTRGKPMYMRTVVPIYDENYQCIGAVGRSMCDRCDICSTYHVSTRPCPSNDLERRWAAKWSNSSGFTSGHHWYNIHFAKPHIQKSESVYIVEGQGDIWRLSEAGIYNALGLFGLELTQQKFEILAGLGIMNIHLCLDGDEAGQEATKKIYEKLQRYYNVSVVNLPNGVKDLGDMSVESVKRLFADLN